MKSMRGPGVATWERNGPRADQPWARQAAEQPQHGIDIAIRPAADGGTAALILL
jgi:hypothetical protein